METTKYAKVFCKKKIAKKNYTANAESHLHNYKKKGGIRTFGVIRLVTERLDADLVASSSSTLTSPTLSLFCSFLVSISNSVFDGCMGCNVICPAVVDEADVAATLAVSSVVLLLLCDCKLDSSASSLMPVTAVVVLNVVVVTDVVEVDVVDDVGSTSGF